MTKIASCKPDNLMPIGRFAELTRLSFKALRLYDSMGLLPPTYIDPNSGYRYYTESQVPKAKLISQLRNLEMPLDQIATILNSSEPEALKILNDYWQKLEAKVGKQRKLVQYLREYMEGSKPMTAYNIQVRDVTKQKVISILKKVYVWDLEKLIKDSFTTLHNYVEQEGGQVVGNSMVLYHGFVSEDCDGPVEICLPVVGDFTPTDTIELCEQPSHQQAFTCISLKQCEYPEILKAYDAVSDWLRERGYKMSGSPREIYFNHSKQISPDDPFCDVAFPFRKPC